MPLVPPSLLNFVSGIAAGAGINLLTSLSGVLPRDHRATVIDAVAWIVAAVFLAVSAHIADGVERNAALVIDNMLTKSERADILRSEVRQVVVRYAGALILSALWLIAAALLVPGLDV